jgi:hypothetical protein
MIRKCSVTLLASQWCELSNRIEEHVFSNPFESFMPKLHAVADLSPLQEVEIEITDAEMTGMVILLSMVLSQLE